MKHAFCGHIHNFTCMNSKKNFTCRANLCDPSRTESLFLQVRRFTCVSRAGKKRSSASSPASQPGRQAGQASRPDQPARQQASQPSQSSQPASKPASQPSQPPSQPPSQTTSPASPAGRLQETSKKLYTDSIMCSTCV